MEARRVGERLNASGPVLPLTGLYNDAIRLGRRVKEARAEMDVCAILVITAILPIYLFSSSSTFHEPQGPITETRVSTLHYRSSDRCVF